eukprot:scaffold15934_cov52-Cyclotella_meneghiniana.AAC.11
MGLDVGMTLTEGAAETDGEYDTVGEDVGSVGFTVGDEVIKLLLDSDLELLLASPLPLLDSSFVALPTLTFSALPTTEDLPLFDAVVGMKDIVGLNETLGEEDGITETDGDDDTVGDCVGDLLLPLLLDVLPLLGGACMTSASLSLLLFPDLAVMLFCLGDSRGERLWCEQQMM